MLFNWLKNRRRRRLLQQYPIPDDQWHEACRNLPWLSGLGQSDLACLRDMATWFLGEKRFFGAAGLEVEPRMALTVAVMACFPVLRLGYDCLDGWTTVILYPGEFRVRHHHEDEHGVVSEEVGELAGEAWDIGPLVLSWTDVEAAMEYPDDGENVVFHEIAHKLDMLNGEPNGHPPLHASMDAEAWARDMRAAYESLNKALDAGRETPIDPYAATDPAEFFAVTSEYFFEAPQTLAQSMPAVYSHLEAYFEPKSETIR